MYPRIILFILFPLFGFSQAPQKINFQSILRNTNGEVVSNKLVSLKISILSGSISGLTVYSETHTKTTDPSGLISLQIGNGTVLSGIFADIAWGDFPHFIKLEADFSGGNNFVLLGSQELMSVPYALYASKSDTSSLNLANRFNSKVNISDTSNMLSNYRTGLNSKLNISDFPLGTTTGNIQYWNGTSWVNLPPGQNGQTLILTNGIPSWSGGAFPTVITDSVSEVTISSALVGGNVIFEGGTAIYVTERGIVWGTSDNPTLSDRKVLIGYGTGSFRDSLKTENFYLRPNTTYYVRAFATNLNGTSYGETIMFTTPAYTNQVALFGLGLVKGSLSDKNVLLVHSLINQGIGEINEVGIVYSKLPNPTITDSKTVITNYQGNRTYVLANLDQSTKYYVRVYAINDYGISYSNEVQFITKFRPDLVEDFDGNIYGLLQIGNQIWMNENLKVSHFRNGAEIPKIEADNSWSNLSTAAWSNYNNLKQSPYGKLYNWYSTIGDSICPIGWHVPSNEDFSNLINFLDGDEKAAKFLRTPPSSSWHLNETTNNFNAFPAGFRFSNGDFAGINQWIYYWSKTETGINNAVMLYLHTSLFLSDLSFVPGYTKNLGSYIRCLKNN